ncbi:hypothetical protein [Chitinilyticum litopenaei]|uniref:hypothetical protein n=1 Tax=Chitinilyticum litopenaei TaxID=1121276 RepID=UPI001186D549|nr:hypothetical protein [Chitinilyticum litopenaei]
MSCPCCQTVNPATSARCYQCGTVLIHEAVGFSKEARETAQRLNRKMHTGYGGVIGLILAFLISPMFGGSLGALLPICTGAGALIGRLIAIHKENIL